jgi:hypothetical protein
LIAAWLFAAACFLIAHLHAQGIKPAGDFEIVPLPDHVVAVHLSADGKIVTIPADSSVAQVCLEGTGGSPICADLPELRALPANPEQTIAALRATLGDQIAALGHCRADLGDLQGELLKGQLQAPAVVVAQVKSQVEKANPGKTLDTSTWKLVDAPKK